MVLSHYYKTEGYNVSCLFIDHNQKSVPFEKKASKGIASYLELPYHNVELANNYVYGEGEIIGRNMFLISTALMVSSGNFNVISIGIIRGSVYLDCKKVFIDRINEFVQFQTDYRTIVQAPLLDMSKQAVHSYALRHELPLELSYSCENGIRGGCNVCLSCKDKLNYGQAK